MASDERRLRVDDLVEAEVRGVLGLSVRKDGDGAVRTPAAELAHLLEQGRDADGVVKGETEGLPHLLAALAIVEEVLLDILEDGEERTAGRVCGDLTGVAHHAAGKSTCK